MENFYSTFLPFRKHIFIGSSDSIKKKTSFVSRISWVAKPSVLWGESFKWRCGNTNMRFILC